MQYMRLIKIRNYLKEMLLTRGELRKFCLANNLDYNWVYKFASGDIKLSTFEKTYETLNLIESRRSSE